MLFFAFSLVSSPPCIPLPSSPPLCPTSHRYRRSTTVARAPPHPVRRVTPTTPPSTPKPVPTTPVRYNYREAKPEELYTIADIRCEAFYGAPADAHYYPVRRREIYVAIRDRLAAGNKSLVVLDGSPSKEWEMFVDEKGGLVVGSCDIAMHGEEGQRIGFEKDVGGKLYVSSMAVRKEWRGRRLAQGLLREVEELGKTYGVQEIYLHVEWDNCVAVHVYGKCGFQVVEGRPPKWVKGLAKKEHTLMKKVVGT